MRCVVFQSYTNVTNKPRYAKASTSTQQHETAVCHLHYRQRQANLAQTGATGSRAIMLNCIFNCIFPLVFLIAFARSAAECLTSATLNVHFAADAAAADDAYYRPVPRHFWQNTGFCPPAPTNASPVLDAFFNGVAVHRTMDLLSAWPAVGHRTTVRVHWLLNLIDARDTKKHRHPQLNRSDTVIEYDFRRLDAFLDHLVHVDLVPVIEFMGNPSGQMQQRSKNIAADWTALVSQMLSRYIGESRRLFDFRCVQYI